MKVRKSRALSLVLVLTLILQVISTSIPFLGVEAAERTATLVGDLQTELGAEADWAPEAEETIMTHVGDDFYEFTGTLPAGNYEYKVAINKSWDESYGEGAGNLKLEIADEQEVTFYYNDTTHAISTSLDYTPIPKEKAPRLVGDLQSALGIGDDWSPETSTGLLSDDNYDGVYTYTATVPKGTYEFKIALGSNWDKAYPADNVKLNVLADSDITFMYNEETTEVSTNYDPGTGDINKGLLSHNTWDEAYRAPFGAIAAGTPVTLRISSKKGDVQKGSLYVKNNHTGTSKTVKLTKAGTIDSLDFWEATFTPEDKGVYGYKFIVEDKTVKAEYGEDTAEGKLGKAVDSNAELFQLTVFDPTYQTPDWMKESVVYQIFPDRFYNGNESNDNAKDYARGLEPIEHRDWNELPDNPRLADDANYDGDAIWSNDFFGGDIAGVQAKLDYIESLGVNTIYLNPVAEAASNHKYDAADWKAVDPLFGTPEEFEAFTKELADRDMHLILDGVFNHVGDDSIYFDRYGKYDTVGAYEYWTLIYDLMNDEGVTEDQAKEEARKQLEAEGQTFNDEYGYHNWFNIKNEKVTTEDGQERYDYQAWWGFDSLPEIKSIPGEVVDYASELNNQQFADYIMYDDDSAAKSWITNGGSGWRLDVANEVDPAFWVEFRNELKAESFAGTGKTLKDGEEPLILGEIWDDASEYFLGDQYDSVMNYRFRGALLDYLKNGNAARADETLTAVREDYPEEAYYALMNLMGSHDTARAVYLLGNGSDTFERAEFDPNYNHELGVKRLKLASIIQMGYPGAPTIYYGDESGVTGSKDPDDRRTYDWENQDQDLLNHYKEVGAIRTANSDLLAYGDIETIYAEGSVYAFARMDGEKFAIIATNSGDTDQTIEIDVEGLVINGISLKDSLDTSYDVTTAAHKVSITVPAMDGRMLISENGQSLAFPESVSDVSATAGEGEATVTWNGTAAEYKVYVSTLKGARYTEIATVSDTSYTVKELTNGQKYFFAVAAVDSNGNASVITETSTPTIPHYEWKDGFWIGTVTTLADQVLDLANTFTVTGEAFIPGATEANQAEGLTAVLQVQEPGQSDWTEYNAEYTGQSGNNNAFEASFRPLKTGEFKYQFAFTTDLGETWKTTDTNTVTFTKNTTDSEAPAESVTLEEPVKESGQVNLNWSLVDPVDPYLVAIERDGKIIAVLEDASVTTYKDYTVENGTEYKYKVIVFDQSGNTTSSNEVAIMPDIVMVEVTFKVKAPNYTPLDTKVTMPGELNGWSTSAWEMSRNGAVTPDWEITKTIPEGTVVSYKFTKGESWDQEGLADHTRNDKTDDDVSYYGYGAIGTEMKVTVENQGNNKMVVQDEILRWIDRPVVITSPAQNAKVSQETVTVEGNAIKEGVLTINGETVTVNEDMTFSHEVTLEPGVNNIPVTIEPSEENKADVFLNDSGAIGKNTKNITLTVEREGGEEPTEPETPETQIERLSGDDRYETAVEVSKKGFESSETVILARGDHFADALAGTPLAAKYDAPILLTDSKKLTPATKAEIERLGAKKVVILGGNIAVSTYIRYTLEGMDLEVTRVNGENRYETAAFISALVDPSPEKAIVVNGWNFPDAISIAPYAAENMYPILLTDPNQLPEETMAALKGVKQTVVIGGEKVVSKDVMKKLPSPKRVSGDDRYSTAAKVATTLNPSDTIFIATGTNFADALTCSVLAAHEDATILLVKKDSIPSATTSAIQTLKGKDFTILGGKSAVSQKVEDGLKGK
ncbi:alpha amylase N-terminal ig-like domain-containing protein [Bacillus coahuilensis]|uniref:alpha amylase N-terminal ig-like domain-containing protein n=1 Tax=Bacillus coahuilensis TaxID=408580 RepID=UPI0007508199|nr:alpha amylase N-terminal ig-like domain-containing protein [Bacillus coahuilensis]